MYGYEKWQKLNRKVAAAHIHENPIIYTLVNATALAARQDQSAGNTHPLNLCLDQH